jgi:hypothetical protein
VRRSETFRAELCFENFRLGRMREAVCSNSEDDDCENVDLLETKEEIQRNDWNPGHVDCRVADLLDSVDLRGQ